MSQIAAAELTSRVSLPRNLEALVDEYIARTFARFERVLVAGAPGLVEPRVSEPARALRLVDCFVDALAGFAVGATFGAVATAVRRSFATPVKDAVDDVIARLRHGTPLGLVVDTHAVPGFFAREIADRKPLLDRMASQLQARLCHAAVEARRHVTAVHGVVARLAPDQLPFLANALQLLLDDDATALAFGDQLAVGWAHYVAAATRTARAPAVRGTASGQRTAALWRAWFTRVAGAPVLDELTPAQVVAAGFVMRID